MCVFGDLFFFLWLYQFVCVFFYQGVQVDVVDQIEWVQYIFFGFGYFLVFCVVYQVVYVYLFEGYLVGEFQCYYDYLSDLEENDVEIGDQYIGGVEGFQFFGLFWLVQGGEGLQC